MPIDVPVTLKRVRVRKESVIYKVGTTLKMCRENERYLTWERDIKLERKIYTVFPLFTYAQFQVHGRGKHSKTIRYNIPVMTWKLIRSILLQIKLFNVGNWLPLTTLAPVSMCRTILFFMSRLCRLRAASTSLAALPSSSHTPVTFPYTSRPKYQAVVWLLHEAKD